MNYLKFTSYAYLLASILFAFDAYSKYQANETNKAIISGIFAAVGVFMFFFRRKFGRKYDNSNLSKDITNTNKDATNTHKESSDDSYADFGIFMYFSKRKFGRKFDDQNKKS